MSFTATDLGVPPEIEMGLFCESTRFDVLQYSSITSTEKWMLQEPICSASMVRDSPVIKASAVLRGHKGSVNHAAWDNEGRRIVTASEDGTARIYYARIEDLLVAACQRAVRNMSEAEWARYMGSQPYRETCPGKLVPDRDF